MSLQNEGANSETTTEIILVGSGIMSSTLGVFLNLLQPGWKIKVFEKLDEISKESSSAWNNAGTGHAAYCELNYTPEKDGKIDCTKAYAISEQFEESKQFWSYLVEEGILKNTEFINRVPHYSFVTGDKDVDFLRKRHEALVKSPLFSSMEYTEDKDKLKEWFPLMMEDRDPSEKVAATRMDLGTDVNFGLLASLMFDSLESNSSVDLFTGHDVRNISRASDGKRWEVKVKDLHSGETTVHIADYIFIGAGGGALPLLMKSGIPESKGYGGFPVSGQWLRCVNEDIIRQHHAKVYGKAKVGAPPMSVPHLDSRVINGKAELLFGPFAGFSTKFLKEGSYWDLPCSVKTSNIIPLIQVGLSNIPLTKYLIQQVMLKPKERVDELKEFFPNAKFEDWALEIAGQRVQIIKKGKDGKGILEFGTELVSSADGTISALLGASPGASTAVSVMLNLLKKCFPQQSKENNWEAKLKQMIPSYGLKLRDNEELLKSVRATAAEKLNIKD
ncbi:MAG: malate dehydrogenase (quinone) [Flavobacteriia bacterium]|nr:malate dehydrogenase (quinone) [Flavobacteriia bacterium]OJX34919.1 MAG: malate:quinone oxidoreductase [Flavobacteriia bacterium 40-80]